MKGLMAYSGITTKVRAMHSKLLSKQDYETVASLNSVQEFADFLKRHPAYEDYFRTTGETILHRRDIELLLRRTVFQDFSKIYLFCDQEQRNFMDLYFLRYEVNILKTCLRSVFDSRDIELDFSRYIDFYNKHASIDIPTLATCTTVNDLISALNGSKYHESLSRLEHMTNPTLFDYESALDLYYFMHFWKRINKLYSGEQLTILQETVGCRIDMLNIQWIFRSKKYYNIQPADMYALIIPIHYHLKKSDIAAMIDAENDNNFFLAVSNTYYAQVYKETNSTSLEKLYRIVLNKVYDSTERKYPYSIACINTYLYYREYEINRLTSVLECIHYALTADQILQIIS